METNSFYFGVTAMAEMNPIWFYIVFDAMMFNIQLNIQAFVFIHI